jgi:hypothetical protein
LIFSRDVYFIWWVYDQERGISNGEPERSACQIKQGAFTCSEVTFNGGLLKEGDGLGYASCAFQGQVFDIRLAIPVMG